MNHPWGISGPAFLWLYAAGFVLAVGWAVAVRRQARRPRVAEPTPVLTREQLAYLAGGPRRVIELSIARMLWDGTIRINRDGWLTPTTTNPPADRLDRAVLAAIGRGAPVRAVFGKVRVPEYFDGLAGSLTVRRLLLSPAEVSRARRLSILAPLALLVVGMARGFVGVAEDLPVDYLAIQLGVTVVLLLVLNTRKIRPRTVPGDDALAAARHATTSGIGLVALFGLALYPGDPTVREALLRSSAVRTDSSGDWTYGAAGAGVLVACSTGSVSCGGSSGSDGSGGSGGGSSCGGGCGGGSA